MYSAVGWLKMLNKGLYINLLLKKGFFSGPECNEIGSKAAQKVISFINLLFLNYSVIITAILLRAQTDSMNYLYYQKEN